MKKSKLISLAGYVEGISDILSGDSVSLSKVVSAREGLQTIKEELNKLISEPNPERNKYSREIKPGVYVDVYDVLRAFKTDCSAMDHAAKKILAAGKRGHKDTLEDKEDIIKSVRRSIEQDKEWNGYES